MRKMKESGIDWIGEIPSDWEVVKVKYLTSQIGSGKTPKGGSEVYVQTGVMFLRSQNVYNDGLHLDDVVYIDEKTNEEMASTKVKPYDVLLNITGASIGRTCMVTKNFQGANVNQHVCILRPIQEKILPILFEKIMQSSFIFNQIYSVQNGSSREGLNFDDIGNLVFTLPHNIEEQQKIASFLEGKCNNIDKAIWLQLKQIEALKQYKVSVINENVTSGLNNNISMKDSSINWISKIPQHWQVIKLKFLGELNSSGVDKKIVEGEPLYKSIHYVDVYRNSLSEIGDGDEYLVISEKDTKAETCKLKIGDVLFTNSSETPEDIGHSTVVGGELENILFGYHLMRFRPNNNMYLQYEKYLFGCNYVRKWFDFRAKGITRYGIVNDDFSSLLIPLPPLEEQKEIADYLDKKCEDIDKAISIKQGLIEKLNEYKKSLIFEVVTGKIEI